MHIFEWKKYVHARWLWRTNTWERRRTYVSYKTAGLANDCFNQIKNLPPYTTWVIISEKPIAPTKLVSTDLLNLTLFQICSTWLSQIWQPSFLQCLQVITLQMWTLKCGKGGFYFCNNSTLSQWRFPAAWHKKVGSRRVHFLTSCFFRVVPSVGSVSVDFRRGNMN